MPRSEGQPDVAPLELLPATADQELVRLSGLLESATEHLAKAIMEDALKEAAWKVAEARSLLRSSATSEDRRRAEAVANHEEDYKNHLVAKARRDALTEKARALRTRIEGLRTLCANLRSMT